MNNTNNNVSFTPVIIYHNADSEKNKILLDNKGKAGVYMWTHIETGRIYVGSAIDLSKRLSLYFSVSSLKKDNYYICRALLHHTHSAFSLSILKYTDILNLDKKEAQKLILQSEQFFLDIIFSLDKPNTYNILQVAGSPIGYKHTEEALAKFSGKNHPLFGKSRLPETIAKISNAMIGKIHSAETKALIGKVHKGKCVSAETKALMSLAKNKIVFVYTLDSDSKDLILYKFFNSCIDAAKFFDCTTRTLSRYLDKNKLYKNQWIFSSSLINNEK
jgi:group I intron endonuclease